MNRQNRPNRKTLTTIFVLLAAVVLICSRTAYRPGTTRHCATKWGLARGGRIVGYCTRAELIAAATQRLGSPVRFALKESAGGLLKFDASGRAALHPWPIALRLSLGLGMDINRASAASLRLLPGIGKGLAKRIADDRAKNGPFAGPHGLLRVRGIGPAKLGRLLPFLSADGARRSGPARNRRR